MFSGAISVACSSSAARRILDCTRTLLWLSLPISDVLLGPLLLLEEPRALFAKHVVAHRSVHQKPIICSAESPTTPSVHPAVTMARGPSLQFLIKYHSVFGTLVPSDSLANQLINCTSHLRHPTAGPQPSPPPPLGQARVRRIRKLLPVHKHIRRWWEP